jgi:hypothetical protein
MPQYIFTFDAGDGVGWSTGPTSNDGAATGSPPYGFSRTSGSTPSLRTGPSTAHGGHGYYYYAEASAPRGPGDVFELAYDGRVCGTALAVGVVGFRYLMHGDSMGTLAVVRWDGTEAWRRDGEQSADSNGWKSGTATVGGGSFLFRAIRGTTYRSDVAIDTVTVGCTHRAPPTPPRTPPMPPFPRCVASFDLVLVIDTSGSMFHSMSAVRAVAISLFDQLDLAFSRAAVVTFSSQASLLVSLDGSHHACISTATWCEPSH